MANTGIVVDIAATEVQQKFFEFLCAFKAEDDDESITIPTYVHQLNQMVEREATTLFADFNHILEFNVQLAEQIEDEFYR